MSQKLTAHIRPKGQSRSRAVSEARTLLAVEVRKAQDLLTKEATRRQEEATRQEAYCIPASMICAIVEALKPGSTPGEFEEAHKTVEGIFTASGWNVIGTFGPHNPAYIRTRAPLRKLAALMERHPRHHLTRQVLTLVGLTLDWCNGASLNYGNGTPPEGVEYPLISVSMVSGLHGGVKFPKEYAMRTMITNKDIYPEE